LQHRFIGGRTTAKDSTMATAAETAREAQADSGRSWQNDVWEIVALAEQLHSVLDTEIRSVGVDAYPPKAWATKSLYSLIGLPLYKLMFALDRIDRFEFSSSIPSDSYDRLVSAISLLRDVESKLFSLGFGKSYEMIIYGTRPPTERERKGYIEALTQVAEANGERLTRSLRRRIEKEAGAERFVSDNPPRYDVPAPSDIPEEIYSRLEAAIKWLHESLTQQKGPVEANKQPDERPAFRRDHKWLEWYETADTDTYHSHAKIRNLWNATPEAERREICPMWCGTIGKGESGRRVVVEAIKKASAERESQKTHV